MTVKLWCIVVVLWWYIHMYSRSFGKRTHGEVKAKFIYIYIIHIYEDIKMQNKDISGLTCWDAVWIDAGTLQSHCCWHILRSRQASQNHIASVAFQQLMETQNACSWRTLLGDFATRIGPNSSLIQQVPGNGFTLDLARSMGEIGASSNNCSWGTS